MSRLVVGWTQHGSSSLADMVVVKAYPAAHGAVDSQEESPEHDFDTWYREAASRGEVEKKSTELRRRTRRQTCPGSKKKPWTRKALSNSLLQQKLIVQCGSGVRRILDLRLCDIYELVRRIVSKPPSI